MKFYMPKLSNKLRALVILALSAHTGLSIDSALATENTLNNGIDLSAEYVHQTFSDADGDITTLNLSPWLRWGDNWEARLDLPLLRASGEYLVSSATPRLANFCSFAQSHPRYLARLLQEGRISQEQLARCDNISSATGQTDNSGIGDITLWLNKLIEVSDIWVLMPQVAYKSDTGDDESGLGSGSQDALTEISVLGQYQRLKLTLLTGYDWVLKQPPQGDPLQDRPYALLEAEWQFPVALRAGARWRFEAAKTDYLDDVKTISAYLAWNFLKNYNAQVYLQKHGDIVGYPEQEFGASISATF